MAGFDVVSYAASNKYTDETVEGGGALKGKNCVVESIEKIEGYTRVHFKWTLDDGTVQRQYTDVPDGQKGDRGDRGAIGPQGLQGIQGVQGETGLKGDQGIQGIQGIQGPQGIQGIQGEKGDDGYPFLIYKQYDDISEFNASDFPEVGLMFMVMTWDVDPVTGDEGYPVYRFTNEGNPPYSLVIRMNTQGIKGEKGDKGDTGAQGPQGIQGEQGEKGEKGEKGDTGAQGIQGEQGIGLPDGGNTGDVLVKYSNSDYDFDWKGTTDRVQPGNTGLVESQSVYSAIQTALSSIYTPRGDLTCAELTSSLLIEANVGNVYEMTDAGTTTALFLQGEGETISIGANVGIINAGEGRILFNLMPGAFDLSDYQKKDLTSAVEGETTVEGALGALSTSKQPKTLDTPITVSGQSRTTVEGALSSINNSIPQKYARNFSTTHDRYVEIGTMPYSTENAIIACTLDLIIFAGGERGSLHIDMKSRQQSLEIKGWTDYNLESATLTSRAKIVASVENDSLCHLYIDSDYQYLQIALFATGNLTVGNFPASASITGTEVFNSLTNKSIVNVQKLVGNLSYSTSETNTGKTWIDGKPIYRKVVDLGALPNNTMKNVTHGITNIDTVTDYYGVAKSGSNTTLKIPYVATETTDTIAMYVSAINVAVKTKQDMSAYSGYAVIEYTKTTN